MLMVSCHQYIFFLLGIFYMYMFLVYFFLFLSPNVWAFKITLMDSNLELGQGKYSTTATIVNDSENMIAIEAGARIRNYNLEGVEIWPKQKIYRYP